MGIGPCRGVVVVVAEGGGDGVQEVVMSCGTEIRCVLGLGGLSTRTRVADGAAAESIDA